MLQRTALKHFIHSRYLSSSSMTDSGMTKESADAASVNSQSAHQFFHAGSSVYSTPCQHRSWCR
jgi:hypothetical protein